MPVQCDEYNGVSVITVQGDLLVEQASAIRDALATRATCSNVVIDLDACRFLASSGLEALLDTLNTCESRGGRLMVSGLDPNCRKILELTRLEHRFECHAQLASALKRLQ